VATAEASDDAGELADGDAEQDDAGYVDEHADDEAANT
jgi:hypothetical protein